jgi:hypothetical protein
VSAAACSIIWARHITAEKNCMNYRAVHARWLARRAVSASQARRAGLGETNGVEARLAGGAAGRLEGQARPRARGAR